MIKAVIFDVDGTLLDTEIIYMQAWQEAGKMHGYDIPKRALLETRAVNRQTAEKIFSHYVGENFPYEKVRLDRVKLAEAAIAKSNALLKPGALALLNHLKTQGIPMAVASSTQQKKTVEHLAHAGILDYFGVIVGGDMVEKGKPEPDIFLLAAKMLEVDPEKCLVIEDSPAGITAAHSAGMLPILIPDQVPPNPNSTQMSHAVLTSLDDVKDCLRNLK